MKTKPTVAITGANGFLGTTLVAYFKDAGWNVVALVRNPKAYRSSDSVRAVAYDLSQPVSEAALKNVDLLIHTAYIKHDRSHPDAMASNIQGAKQLLAASRKQGASRNIFISSMSAHEEAISTYGKQKLAIEKLFNTKADTVIRSGLMIGYGGIVRQMADFMHTKRLVPLIGGGGQPLQTIAIYDLARCIQAIYDKKVPGTLVLATPEVYTYKDFYAALGKRISVKPIFLPVPFLALQTALKAAAIARVELSVNEDNLLGLKRLRAMETAKDLAKLGVKLDDLKTSLTKTKLPY